MMAILQKLRSYARVAALLGVIVFAAIGALLLYHPPSAVVAGRVIGKPAFLLSIQSEKSCEGCHKEIDPGLYKQWWDSVHARVNVGCAGCHGEDHEAIFAAKGRVSAGMCGTCHETAVTEFASSGHATTEADALKTSRFMLQSPAMRQEGCMGCHSIGRQFEDGSVGACNKCHPGHSFSSAIAREPEACEVCHIGPDHPQVEAYRTSVHGVLYFQDRDVSTSPTCVTCHMPEGTHGSPSNLTYGEIASGAVLVGSPTPSIAMRTLSLEQMEANRGRMLKACAPCHTKRFAEEQMLRADAIKLEADSLVAIGAAILQSLRDEGALQPMPEDRPPHPISGHEMVLGGQQTYENTSGIEQAFFRLYKFYHAKTYKSAYHHSPDITHWMGIVPMKMELDRIRSEASQLRRAQKTDGP
jgi:hydroxylamine dehydrogenase